MEPTPTPSPTLDIGNIGIPVDAIGVVELVLLWSLIGGTAFLLIWALVRSSRSPAPAMLVTALSILTLVSVVAFVMTREEVLATLAATGLGALAGAVSSQFMQDVAEGKHAATAPPPPPVEAPVEPPGGAEAGEPSP